MKNFTNNKSSYEPAGYAPPPLFPATPEWQGPARGSRPTGRTEKLEVSFFLSRWGEQKPIKNEL